MSKHLATRARKTSSSRTRYTHKMEENKLDLQDLCKHLNLFHYYLFYQTVTPPLQSHSTAYTLNFSRRCKCLHTYRLLIEQFLFRHNMVFSLKLYMSAFYTSSLSSHASKQELSWRVGAQESICIDFSRRSSHCYVPCHCFPCVQASPCSSASLCRPCGHFGVQRRAGSPCKWSIKVIVSCGKRVLIKLLQLERRAVMQRVFCLVLIL